ncbi:hypothetical protein [Actinocrispum wychmicini]|uniref:hypothetical protein n=1 Tax=Actinocrispum wychmicini TaxID=1213861 RepID=UPI00104F1BB6|nr:hypothetical protein [Actinocrispum wychmicini]
MRLLISAAAVLVLVAGCAKSVQGTALPADDVVATTGSSRPSLPRVTGSRTPPSSGSTSASGDGGSVSVSALQGHWEGTYICGQGETGLKLDIGAADTIGTAEVTFTFFPLASNPQAASGSYVMKLSATAGQLKFVQDHWVQRPNGYDMVDLLVQGQPESDTMDGKVVNASCSTFTVTRK